VKRKNTASQSNRNAWRTHQELNLKLLIRSKGQLGSGGCSLFQESAANALVFTRFLTFAPSRYFVILGETPCAVLLLCGRASPFDSPSVNRIRLACAGK
jgi:hypothetical protein